MKTHTYSLTFEDFKTLAKQGNLIPLYREILADYETPVSAFAKIDHGPSAYLLESVEGGENWARYSFLGSGSPAVIHEQGGDLILTTGNISRTDSELGKSGGAAARDDAGILSRDSGGTPAFRGRSRRVFQLRYGEDV